MIEEIQITSREQWLAARKKDVTASVAGALVGVHDYLTPLELWGQKTGRIPDIEETAAMKRGRLLEPVAIELLKEKHPTWEFRQPGVYLRDPEKRIGATPDVWAITPDKKLINIQIKTVWDLIFKKEWLDQSTREIILPDWIAIQAMIEMDLSLADSSMAAIMTVGMGLDLWEVEVPRHIGVMKAIHEAVADFWRVVASGERMAPDYGRDRETLRSLRIYDGEGAPARDLSGNKAFGAALDRLEKAKAIIKAANDDKDHAEAEITSQFGNHDACTYSDKIVTWRLQTRKAHQVKESTFPVLRVSERK